MRCFHCKKKIKDESKRVFLAPDFDVVCDEACKRAYEKQRDQDLTAFATMSDREFYGWMGVPELYREP